MTREEAKAFLKTIPGKLPSMSVMFVPDEDGNRDPFPCIAIHGDVDGGEQFVHAARMLGGPLMNQFEDLLRDFFYHRNTLIARRAKLRDGTPLNGDGQPASEEQATAEILRRHVTGGN